MPNPVMQITHFCQDEDQDQDSGSQDQDQGKTFLVFLYQNLRSLIQCQHKQQHQHQQRIHSIHCISLHNFHINDN